LSPPSSLTMFPEWPSPTSVPRAVFIWCDSESSFKLSTHLPSLSPWHVSQTDGAYDLWHLLANETYDSMNLLSMVPFFGICLIQGDWNLWHQLAYKAWEGKTNPNVLFISVHKTVNKLHGLQFLTTCSTFVDVLYLVPWISYIIVLSWDIRKCAPCLHMFVVQFNFVGWCSS